MFISPSKPYKSGKFLAIRAHIPTSKQIKQEYCLIYDENEKPLNASTITETSKFIPLIHIEGIKFSSKSFQLDINLRQMMVLSVEDNIKKGCMIKYPRINTLDKSEDLEKLNPDDSLKSESLEITSTVPETIIPENNKVSLDNNNKAEIDKDEIYKSKSDKIIESGEDYSNISDIIETSESINPLDNLKEDGLQEDSLAEVELNVDNTEEEILLKKPKDVYFEIYKAAREKAKHMKQAAVKAYLEVRNIKTKYMLDDLTTSDDEFNNSEFEE